MIIYRIYAQETPTEKLLPLGVTFLYPSCLATEPARPPAGLFLRPSQQQWF
jgi:hypothetical protein